MEANEFLDADASISNQGPERSLPDLAVIGNGKAAMRRLSMTEDNVAATLLVDFVTEPPDVAHRAGLSTGDSRKDAHIATSMISSLMVGGMGSSRSLRLST